MPRQKFFILKVSPQTHVRATQNDKILFRIPEEELFPEGLLRKKRLQKYNQYKADLFEASREVKFIMPESNSWVQFYVPVPRSWTKKKKDAHHMEPHQSKPDNDNLIKAMKDAIMKEDKKVWDYRITKRWVNLEEGYIKIIVK